MLTWQTLWAFLHVVGWATYVGGALAMELIWRPAQHHIPPSQTGVVCHRMGRRYRWLALSMLALIGVTGVARLVESGAVSLSGPTFRAPLMLSSSYGRTMLAVAVCWAVLVAAVLVLTIVAHPALHVRESTTMTAEERGAARERVQQAIGRMDLILRLDLGVALLATLLGASLRFGGLL